MADLRPFRALRPPNELAAQVASPPYDVLNTAEARAMAAGNPRSFLHVIKPEIGLPEGTDLYSDEVYAAGARTLSDFVESGLLVRDETPSFYVYRQTMGEHTQTGVVAGASVAEYDSGAIKKHEKTRPNKEDDRTRHLDALSAQTGPVFVTYRRRAGVDALVAQVCQTASAVDFVADDGIGHTLWVVDETAMVEAIRAEFAAIDAIYIADGHHRSACASRVSAARGPEGAHTFFLTVAFPDDQMKILDYNRVVFDLNGHSPESLVAAIGEAFEIVPCAESKPAAPREFTMLLDEQWYRLTAREGTYPAHDPVDGLDVSILQNNLLSPLLAIGDPRTDTRVDFIGGIRGTEELARRCATDAAVAFAVYPTSMDELIAIADAGEIMPPKSTWFEPKLRSGLFVRPIDSE
jgi:uncharacterized protein (DUF1015 family)